MHLRLPTPRYPSTTRRSGSISHPNSAPFATQTRIFSRNTASRSLLERISITNSGQIRAYPVRS